MPAMLKVRASGTAKFRNTMVAETSPPAGMFGEGKYWESGRAWPSTLRLVTIAGTPATSRRLKLVCQLSPCASGLLGQTVLGQLGMTAAAPAGIDSCTVLVAPPP